MYSTYVYTRMYWYICLHVNEQYICLHVNVRYICLHANVQYIYLHVNVGTYVFT